MCMSSFSNVIYHKFPHSAAFFMLSGQKVNIMLEFTFILANFIIFLFFQHLSVITFLAIMLFAAGILGFVFVGEVSIQTSR